MMGPIKIYSCGTYHPWRYRGERNPRSGDRLSKAMMDLKDASNSGYAKAVNIFTQLLTSSLQSYVIGRVAFTDVPFEITIVPSHAEGKVSQALIKIAQDIAKKFPNAVYNQSLQRKTTVVSAHKGAEIVLSNIICQQSELHPMWLIRLFSLLMMLLQLGGV